MCELSYNTAMYASFLCTVPYLSVVSYTTPYYDLPHTIFLSHHDFVVGVLRKTEIFRCHVHGTQGCRLEDKQEASFAEKEKAIVQSLEIGKVDCQCFCSTICWLALWINLYEELFDFKYDTIIYS